MLKITFLILQIVFDIFVIMYILNDWRNRK